MIFRAHREGLALARVRSARARPFRDGGPRRLLPRAEGDAATRPRPRVDRGTPTRGRRCARWRPRRTRARDARRRRGARAVAARDGATSDDRARVRRARERRGRWG